MGLWENKPCHDSVLVRECVKFEIDRFKIVAVYHEHTDCAYVYRHTHMHACLHVSVHTHTHTHTHKNTFDIYIYSICHLNINSSCHFQSKHYELNKNQKFQFKCCKYGIKKINMSLCRMMCFFVPKTSKSTECYRDVKLILY